MASVTPHPEGAVDWLSPIIEDAVARHLCTRIGCTTCGASEFRQNVLQAAQARAGSLPPLIPMMFARPLAQGLAALRPSADRAATFDEPTRLLLYELWFHRVLTDVEPILAGTWAGGVLNRMKAYEAAVDRERAEHAARNDPVRAQERREAKRRAKQAEHAERLKKQAERAREWHLEHDPPTTP